MVHHLSMNIGNRRIAATVEFWFIARVYGFEEADVEELIGSRDW